MAVYGPGCHPQNSIWTEAKLRSIYYFVGEGPVHKLSFGPKCHELFVMLLSSFMTYHRHFYNNVIDLLTLREYLSSSSVLMVHVLFISSNYMSFLPRCDLQQ
jgi:hypothetical protein